MKYLSGILIILLNIGCVTTDKESDFTYLGGEIINPKSNNILFLKDNVTIDTILLDANNKFLSEYPNLEEGLYSFKHGPEFQYLYIHPKDSILIRLNTWDFDESLVFSGVGAEENNFLINLFLENEKEDKLFYDYYELNPEKFESKIDSILNIKESNIIQFKNSREKVSSEFEKIAKIASTYTLYRKKEIYPLVHKRTLRLDDFPLINENFYDFRKTIDLNDKSLMHYHAYPNYVVSQIYNLAYNQREKDSLKSDLTLNILNNIVDKISDENFKNTLLKQVIFDDFFKSGSTCSINNEALDIFFNNCTNEEYISQIKKLVNDSKKAKTNFKLNNFILTSLDAKKMAIKDIIKGQNSVIYFWSSEFMSPEYLAKRIQFLETENPDVLFIGINMQPEINNIKNNPFIKNISSKNQYQLTKDSEANDYVTSKYPRAILVNKNGIIVNGFTNLSSKDFSNQLDKFENN